MDTPFAIIIIIIIIIIIRNIVVRSAFLRQIIQYNPKISQIFYVFKFWHDPFKVTSHSYF
jgi:hypothetical protein